MKKRTIVILLALLGTIGCDQAVKQVAERVLDHGSPRSLVGGIARLHLVENQGGFLGLGATLSPTLRFWLFTVATGVLLLALALWMTVQKPQTYSETVAGALIVAGGLSNLWDRVTRDGRVIDFLNFGVGNVRTGILNVADLAITLGAAVLLWRALRAGASMRARRG